MIRTDPYIDVFTWDARPLGHVRASAVHPALLADLHGRHPCPLCDGETEATASALTPPGRPSALDSGRIETPVTETGGQGQGAKVSESTCRGTHPAHAHDDARITTPRPRGGEAGEMTLDAGMGRGGTFSGLATIAYDPARRVPSDQPKHSGAHRTGS